MIAFGICVLAATVLALTFIVGIKVGGRWFASPPELAPVVVVTSPQLLAELRVAHDHIALMKEGARIVETVQVTPTSPYSLAALPWQQVPSPSRTFWAQGLVDEIQELRVELASATAHLAESRRLHRRALNIGNTLRKRLKAMVPVESFEAVEDLRTRSLSVAKSASSRAAELSTALTELEVARFESLTLDQFNAECDLILDRHQLPVQYPVRERQAA